MPLIVCLKEPVRGRKSSWPTSDASGAALACLCSSDAVYATEAVAAARSLRMAGAKHIYLAGRPGELEPTLRAAGVGTFIYMGCNLLATLAAAQEILSFGQ